MAILLMVIIYKSINHRLNCLIYLEVESFEFILLLLGSFFMSVNLLFLLFLSLLLFFLLLISSFFLTDTLVIRRLRSWPLRIQAQYNFRTSLYRVLLGKFDR